MIIKNKKNGTNVLAFKDGVSFIRVIIRAGESVNVPHLKEINQIVNKNDFHSSRGWFEIIAETEINKSIYIEEKVELEIIEETEIEKAERGVKEYILEEEKKQQITNNKNK